MRPMPKRDTLRCHLYKVGQLTEIVICIKWTASRDCHLYKVGQLTEIVICITWAANRDWHLYKVGS